VATVLIADDDANSRLLVATLLEHAGHVVLEATDGENALSVVATHGPDLVLVDLSMPRMSGINFVRALRSDPEHAATAVVLYTGTGDTEAMRDFMRAYGVLGAIPKPSEPLVFIQTVESALLEIAKSVPSTSSSGARRPGG
jgi:CheY-like chemotaxis protein